VDNDKALLMSRIQALLPVSMAGLSALLAVPVPAVHNLMVETKTLSSFFVALAVYSLVKSI